ncbi:MAG: 30S ribosomal protein S6 [Candidatus Hydrogenedentota bacterium]|nr:MAG: 30S ribosomal protein S6 [Candidatus Hydrogenedentota bacterium]
MRTYEALFIVQPEAAEDLVQTIATGVETLITEDGGVIVRSEIWGKRRLAYLVKKFNEGIYILIRFEAETDIVKKLEGHFHLNEDVIRYLTVLFDEKALRLEVEQAARNEAQLEARRVGGPSADDDDERPARAARAERD